MASTSLPPASAFYVPSLPTLEGPLNAHPTHPLNVWAGLLPSGNPNAAPNVDGKDAGQKDDKIFFLLVNPRKKAGKERLIFWFNGGPGCSSFDGALMEVGPFRMDPHNPGSLVLLEQGGWEEFSGIVFVDQPPGTGLSYAPTDGYVHELDEAAAHLTRFLANFYTVFPEWAGVDTYFSGESYAGQYIPYFADAVLKSPLLPSFPLRGIAIGNGWIDPREQYQGYVDFAYLHKLIEKGTPAADQLDAVMARCQTEIDKFTDVTKLPVDVNHCGGVMQAVQAPFTQTVDGNKVCMNIYDVRLVDDYPACGMNWPPDLADVYPYLRRKDVVAALHATEHVAGWTECNGAVGGALRNRNSPASIGLLPGLLEKIEVLLFSGEQDLICAHTGTERLINRLEWEGIKGFGNATVNDWFLGADKVGEWTTRGNLTYAKVADSSHMVPYDVPNVAHDMMLRFMHVDLSALVAGGTAGQTSRVGSSEKVTVGLGVTGPLGGSGETSNGSETAPSSSGGRTATEWEAFYNAGSALTVLLFILLACAGFFFFRARRRRSLLQHHLSAGGRTGSALPLTRRDPLLSSSFEEREPLDRPYSPSGFANVGQPPRINTPGGYSPTSGGGGGHRSTLSVGSSQGGGGRGSPRFSKKGRTVLDEGSEGDVVFDLGDSGSDDDAAVGTQRAGRSS